MSRSNCEDPKSKTMKPEDIVAMKRLGGLAISPDGKLVVFVRTVPILEEDKIQYRSHIWLMSTKGGESFQLTNGPNGDGDPQWSPGSNLIAFTSRRGDKNQIWIMPIAGGEGRQLTYTESGASNPRWSPDGKRIAFMVREKDSKAEEKRLDAAKNSRSAGCDSRSSKSMAEKGSSFHELRSPIIMKICCCPLQLTCFRNL